MKKIKITVLKKVEHSDLIEKYENKIDDACQVSEGQVFYALNGEKPKELCDSAWTTIEPFAKSLLNGEGNFFDGWMKDPMTAMISCNDGFRPVTFFVEVEE